VSAPLFLLPSGALAHAEPGTLLRLDGPEGRHAADVTRLGVGEELLLADGSGRLAHCEVTEVGKAQLDAVVRSLTQEPEASPRFTLVQALAKGDRDLLAIEVGTELGVDAVVPWQADRSISRWRGERVTKGLRKWEQTLLAATKQARRARVPELADLADRHAVVERIAAADLALVLHEEATEPLATVVPPKDGEVVLVVGPEGGITPEETAAFVAAGARPVRLGSTVLRTSTAGSAAVAVLSGQARWR
jgi:16S rRNA (uracil1498-N3)-methyltransferase